MSKTATSFLAAALAAVKADPTLHLFPVKFGDKSQPLLKDYLKKASNDPAKIRAWDSYWTKKTGHAPWWGIAPALSGLVFADVDTKPTKVGQETFELFDMLYGWPETRVSRSPSGGRHHWYRGKHLFHVGRANTSHPDIDFAQYIILPGCMKADGAGYTLIEDKPIAAAPAWFYVEAKKTGDKAEPAEQDFVVAPNSPANVEWAVRYLKNDAPDSIEGKGGEATTLQVAGVLKDHGIGEAMSVELMAEHYNVEGKCDPAWNVGHGPREDDLAVKVHNAYEHLRENAPGSASAESDFADDPPEPMPPLTPLVAKQKAERDKLINRPPEEKAIVATFHGLCEDWVYILGGKLFVCREPNPELGYFMWDKTAFDDAFAYTVGNKAKVSKMMFVRSSKTIRKLNSMCYRPGRPEFHGKQFNLYKPPALKPAPGDTKLWDAHLAYLFPDKADRDLVLNWIAWLLQNLTLKPKHALLIQGIIQGTGKSFIAEVLERILGSHNVSPISQSDLHGTFNRWAEHAKLLLIEELRALDKAEVKNKLHPLITQERITINDKGEKTFPMVNCFGIMAMTNDPVAVPLEDSDRRYLVVQTKAVPRDVREFEGAVNVDYDPDYYKVLYRLLEQPEAMGAIAWELQHRDLKGYDARSRAPFTAAKAEMMAEAAPEIEKWMLDHSDMPPLSYSLVELGEVAEMIPKRLQQRGMDGIVRRVLRQRFKGVPVGQVRVGADRSRMGPKTSLWALGPNGAALLKMRHPKLADLYASERGQVHARIEAEAEADFADDDPAA